MFEPKIYVSSDYHGFIMKNEIVQHLARTERNFVIEDMGPYTESTFDYPVYAMMISDLIKESPGDHLGILISQNGNEMAVAANKIKDIRAIVCWNLLSANQGRTLLDANIICLPSDVNIIDSPLDIIDEFIKIKPSNNNVHFRERYLLEKLIDAL